MDYIETILADRIGVFCQSATLTAQLASLADARQLVGNHYQLPYQDESTLVEYLSLLNGWGFAFVAAGPGWTPADIFQALRARGVVHGTIKTVLWLGPDRPVYGEI